MKKLISLVLALCLACMLIPALAEDDVTGEWYADMMGVAVKFTINADNTFTMEVPGLGQTQEGTWKLEGEEITLTVGDQPEKGTFKDGVLSMTFGGQEVALSREPIEGIKVAEVNAEAKAEDFNGEWTLKYMGMQGLVVDLSAAGEQAESMPKTLKFEDGALVFPEGENSISQMVGGDSTKLEYADGVYSYVLDMGETAGVKIEVKAELLQDGMLALTINMSYGEETMGVQLYYVKAEAEAPAA